MFPRRAFTTMALLLAACCGSVGAAMESATDEITAIEDRLAVACVKADAEAFEALYSDDFTGINANGSVERKGPYIDDLRSGKFKCTSYVISERDLTRVSDTVIIFRARISQQATWDGADCSGDYRLTDVWVLRHGQWRCVQSHWTAIQTQ